jgi:hypothetical protein
LHQETGSPIADTGVVEPIFTAVQSASVITLFSDGVAEVLVCASLHVVESKRQNRLIVRKIMDSFLMFPFIVASPVFDSLLFSAQKTDYVATASG